MTLTELLKILELYQLKRVPRDSSNRYFDEKDEVTYSRRETVAEHVYSSLRLADYFLTNEPEFATLDRLHVYELLLYHDDVEAVTRDVGISKREKRTKKEGEELLAIPILAAKLPAGLDAKLLALDSEFRLRKTPEAQFAYAIDKMDALIHELQYPDDWGQKGFDENNVREWFGSAFTYSTSFNKTFECVIGYLRENRYFEK